MPLYSYGSAIPRLGRDVYISSSAYLSGDIIVGDDSSFWFNVAARGDVHYIRVGGATNVQDGTVIHVTTDTHSTIIGNCVTIGHNVTLHGCTVKDACLIGMGAILLDGCVIEENTMIAAGALVPPGKVVPSGTLFIGSPGKVKRDLTQEELDFLLYSARHYVNIKNKYLQEVSEIL